MEIRTTSIGSILFFDKTEKEVNKCKLDKQYHYIYTFDRSMSTYILKKNIRKIFDFVNNIKDFPENKIISIKDGDLPDRIIKSILYNDISQEDILSNLSKDIIDYLNYIESEDILEQLLKEFYILLKGASKLDSLIRK